MLRKSGVLSFFFLLILITGCSHQYRDLPTQPSAESDVSIPMMDTDLNNVSHHQLGIWTIQFDLENLESTVIPYRTTEAHYNVDMIVPPPEIVINNFNPATNTIDVSVTLSNTTLLDAYDVRLIIFTDDTGHQLLLPDNWTPLWDIPGGLPINPFRAYAKDQLTRIFMHQTQHIQIYLPRGNTSVRFTIDASYPDNCHEPYSITDFTMGYLNDQTGSSCLAEVTVKDWQEDTSKVFLHCPQITGVALDPFEQQTDPEKWDLLLINRTGAISQYYTGYILATSSDYNLLYIYEPVTINVTHMETHWVQIWDGGMNWALGTQVMLDANNDIYVLGHFSGSVDFDPGPEETIVNSQDGARDLFLSKFNSLMNFMWVRTWGGSGYDEWGWSLYIDDTGDLYVTGDFDGSGDFDPGPGEDILTTHGMFDAFVVKYSSNGEYLWGHSWGADQNDICRGITLDANENVNITGYFKNTVDFDPGSGLDERTSNGGSDIYLIKFTSDGDYINTLTWGGTSSDSGSGLSTSNTGNMYMIGDFTGTVDLDPGSGVDEHTSIGNSDVFLCKFGEDGSYKWARSWGGKSGAGVINPLISEDEFIYIPGAFEEIVDFDPDPLVTEMRGSNGGFDVFISKFNKDGDFLWVRTFGGTDEFYGDIVITSRMDESGYIYLPGWFAGVVDFDPGPDVYEITGLNSYDMFLSKLDPDGNFVWARSWRGLAEEAMYSVDFDWAGNIYSTGYFNSELLDFDPGPGEDLRSPLTNQSSGIFLLKLLPNGYWG